MAIRFKGKAIGGFLAMAGVLVSAAAIAPAANAQEPQSVLDAVGDISQNRAGSYSHNRSIWGQGMFMTGLGGFSDQRINGDAASLNRAVEELFILQTQNTPTVRVPDLANPYSTSVQLLPTSQFNSRVVGSELNFEPLPRR